MAAVRCTACSKFLPRSAYSKPELGRGGGGRCRNCAQRVQCDGCNVWLLPEKLQGSSRCRRCQENEQVDRLLQTPKDEVTHFGAFRAMRLQREAEHTMLLVCHKYGIWERMVQQRILDFLRVPYVTSHGGMHYCELCDKAFRDLAVEQGHQVRMSMPDTQADWAGCPGPQLVFTAGETLTVAELARSTNDRWFFKVLKPVTKVGQRTSNLRNDLDSSIFSQRKRVNKNNEPLAITCDAFWAPLDATAQGEQPSQLAEHLQSSTHKSYEAAVCSGQTMLVSRAAIELAGKLGERPTTAMSRFKVGLGHANRFCESSHVEMARKLERVRDLDIPVKFLREVLPHRQDFLWITPDELQEAEDKYEKRKRKGSRKA